MNTVSLLGGADVPALRVATSRMWCSGVFKAAGWGSRARHPGRRIVKRRSEAIQSGRAWESLGASATALGSPR